MLLKRLELQGFKSFAEKTVLDLNTPVTAVVGPNGSGKSNVTDAIRWLLGEREARHLRGAKVEDLIFAGTEKKARMGQAQATLILDNSSGYFPVEYAEVSVSRKINRDGDSQFFINKSEVRLKDILDFFAKTRVGARGLTIISQGDSDMFLRATPEERREMMEEVLGLKEYQLRKTESEKRLKTTLENLDKASALIEEIKPHMRFLKKQVSRYESREVLSHELMDLENNFYGKRLKVFRTETKNLNTQRELLEADIKREEANYKELEENLNKIKESEPKEEKAVETDDKEREKLLARRSELSRSFGKIEAQLEFEAGQRAVKNAGVDFAALLKEVREVAYALLQETEIQNIYTKLGTIVKKIDEIFTDGDKAQSKALIEAQNKLAGELARLDKEIKDITKREEEERSRMLSFSKDFTDAYEKAEMQRKKLESVKQEKQKTQFAIEKVELQTSNLKEELSQIGRTLESIENFAVTEISALDENTAIKRMYRLRGELAGIGELDENLLKEARETEERHTFLTSQVEDLQKATNDLKTLIKELDEKIKHDFTDALKSINNELTSFMTLMFGGGRAKLVAKQLNNEIIEQQNNKTDVEDSRIGIDVELSLPRKRLKGLEVLSGGERALVSVSILFALISVSPPPFLVLDEVDAPLDEANAKRFSNIIRDMSKKTQFIIVTHNRATMEAADFLYGVTMGADGASRVLSLKLEAAKEAVAAA
ncbi:MAG: AAA family ATPase [Candidatus Colwellbacteria bacterium]|nr:AAA family ATPase [Candidatus Colwellbacteria bacterium]